MPSITEVDNIHEKTTDAGVTIGHDLKLSSGKSIKKADGTALLTEAGTLDNVTLGSSVTASANHGAVKTALNASGSAPIYAVRAWVNMNGTGTIAIRASANVSSITDRAQGKWSVTMTTAMEDTNYTIVTSVGTDGNSDRWGSTMQGDGTAAAAYSTTMFTLSCYNSGGSQYDPPNVYGAVIR